MSVQTQLSPTVHQVQYQVLQTYCNPNQRRMPAVKTVLKSTVPGTSSGTTTTTTTTMQQQQLRNNNNATTTMQQQQQQ
jgi:maltose-binding protein MalE